MGRISLAYFERIVASYPGRTMGHNPFEKIVCADGFEISVQAGAGLHCLPDPRTGADAAAFTHVECGYPTKVPTPWKLWSLFAEDEHNPLNTVYIRVPVEAVRALLSRHGGIIYPAAHQYAGYPPRML